MGQAGRRVARLDSLALLLNLRFSTLRLPRLTSGAQDFFCVVHIGRPTRTEPVTQVPGGKTVGRPGAVYSRAQFRPTGARRVCSAHGLHRIIKDRRPPHRVTIRARPTAVARDSLPRLPSHLMHSRSLVHASFRPPMRSAHNSAGPRGKELNQEGLGSIPKGVRSPAAGREQNSDENRRHVLS